MGLIGRNKQLQWNGHYDDLPKMTAADRHIDQADVDWVARLYADIYVKRNFPDDNCDAADTYNRIQAAARGDMQAIKKITYVEDIA